MSAIVVSELTKKADIIKLIDLGRLMRDELQPDLRLDEPYMYVQAERLINDPVRDDRNCWLAYDAGEPIGFFIGFCTSFVTSRDIVASHEYWYVRPDYRKSRAAYLLMKAFEEWSRLRGAIKITVGVALDDIDVARDVEKLFPRLGYKPAGGYYVKKLNKEN